MVISQKRLGGKWENVKQAAPVLNRFGAKAWQSNAGERVIEDGDGRMSKQCE